MRWGQLIKKGGGTVAVLGPNNVKKPEWVFAEHKAHIVEALNEMGKALDDIGVVGVLHQHTGTCVETRDETYAVMEAVDTRYVKFGPDVGQLQKGGVRSGQGGEGLPAGRPSRAHEGLRRRARTTWDTVRSARGRWMSPAFVDCWRARATT